MIKKLNEINKFTYQSLAELLFEIIPQYHFTNLELGYSECFGNYLFMNEFSIRLCEEIEKNKSSAFVSNSFKFINCISETNNLEVLNILRVGILEILYTHGITVRSQVLELLNDKNKIFFLNFSQTYL
jgi:hypothetical protein